MPDCSHYDNFLNATQLPVKSVFKSNHVLLSAQVVNSISLEQCVVWCGSVNNVVVTIDINETQLSNFERLHARPFAESSVDDLICKMCLMRDGTGRSYMWTLSCPKSVLYLWDTEKKCLLSSYSCDDFGIDTS